MCSTPYETNVCSFFYSVYIVTKEKALFIIIAIIIFILWTNKRISLILFFETITKQIRILNLPILNLNFYAPLTQGENYE